ADAEVVIEGLVDTTRQEPEGPFGESHGHIALETFNLPIKVTAVTHKKKAVFTSILSQVTPSESSAIKKVAYEPLFLSYIRNTLGVRSLQRVVMHEPLTNLRPVIFLQFSQDANNSEIWRALNGAANLERQCGKIVIAVSTDVDPSNLDGVVWSMAYRCNMLEDIHILPHRIAGRMGQGKQDASLLIDATQKRPLPPLALPGKEYMARARPVGEARASSFDRAPALARLRSRRLDRSLGALCPGRGGRAVAGERQGDAGAPTRRDSPADPGQRGGRRPQAPGCFRVAGQS